MILILNYLCYYFTNWRYRNSVCGPMKRVAIIYIAPTLRHVYPMFKTPYLPHICPTFTQYLPHIYPFICSGVPLFLTFLTSTKDWKCLTDKCNQSLPLCDQKLSNDDWEATVSLATDKFLKSYKIQCGYDEYISIVNSLYFVAFMVGISVGGALSDRFGRKKMLVMLNYTYCFVIILHAASKTDFRVFALFHTLIGLVAGLAGVIFIYQQELTVGWLRNFGSNVHNEMFSVGMLYGAFLSYYFSDFTTICFMLTIPAVVFNTAIWVWLPESPFWLQFKNRFVVCNRVSYSFSLSLYLWLPPPLFLCIEKQLNND